jgi:hypothetical protein
MDLNLSNDPYDSYRIFQGRIVEQYESMADTEGFTVIDGTIDIEEQQRQVREKVSEMLPQQVIDNIKINISNSSSSRNSDDSNNQRKEVVAK